MLCEIKKNRAAIRTAIYQFSASIARGGMLVMAASNIYMILTRDWDSWISFRPNSLFVCSVMLNCLYLFGCLLSSPREWKQASKALLWCLLYFIVMEIGFHFIFNGYSIFERGDYPPWNWSGEAFVLRLFIPDWL